MNLQTGLKTLDGYSFCNELAEANPRKINKGLLNIASSAQCWPDVQFDREPSISKDVIIGAGVYVAGKLIIGKNSCIKPGVRFRRGDQIPDNTCVDKRGKFKIRNPEDTMCSIDNDDCGGARV